ncbi:MAG: acylneuraminate cytidylyltransferase family protein [Magnetospirillum sp.]|nr:acylneuraminate cytidylyltransferase family protein [Magnetospirillum sp.]
MMLAIVPARGGSKRLPGKNILPFGGHPLVAWSIALARTLPDTICVVSTDDAAIAKIAGACGAEIVMRPPELARDDSSTLDAMIHAGETVRKSGRDFADVMLLQPTCPVRPRDMVLQACAEYAAQPCDSLVAVSQRPLKIGTVEDGWYRPNYEFGAQSRLTSPTWYENGWLYLTTAETMFERRSLTGERVRAFEVPRPFDEVDIDTALDLALGERVLAETRARLGYAPR